MNIETFKKEILSPFCIDECTTPCCDMIDKNITVIKSQFQLLFDKQINNYMFNIINFFCDEDSTLEYLTNRKINQLRNKRKLISQNEQLFLLKDMLCPRYNLKTKECSIYYNNLRPQACEKFPINNSGKIITLDTKCQYVRNNYDEITELLKPIECKIKIAHEGKKLYLDPKDKFRLNKYIRNLDEKYEKYFDVMYR
ncbi:hypothetical protein ACFL1H_01385 [Nanoarchaeota archaeon]